MKSIAPMLATIGKELPRGDGWVFEPKYDGIRILAYVNGRDVALVTRNGLDKTRQFPEIADALRELARRAKRSLVLDGEIVAMHGDTPARFQELQGRMHVTDRTAIAQHREASPASLVAFDLLLDGKKTLVTEPWRVRRKHLAALLQPPGRTNALRLSDVAENGEAMLRTARRNDWEGVMAKRADAPYEPGRRSRDWLKLKIERRQEFVVGGWTEPRNTREHIGAILLGYYDTNGELIYAGHTGTGFTRQSLLAMYRRLEKLARKTSPFTTTPKTNEHPHWTRPSVVVEIKFNEWTADGRLRQPVFLGVRDDKSPREVTHEPESIAQHEGQPKKPKGRTTAMRKGAARTRTAKRGASAKAVSRRTRSPARKARAAAPARASSGPLEALVDALNEIERNGGAGALEFPQGRLEVSNLDKIFFPETRQTKGDLMRYYVRVAPCILPAIADRPLVMKRFPNGVGAKGFFQQRAPTESPDLVRVEPVSDVGLRTQDRLIGGDLPTLLYVVQLGAISIDPWHSRVQSVTHADYSIIDLDPGPRAPFARVVDVAHAVKDVLDELGLHAVPKTSGATGLHIVLPLGPDVPNDGARMLAELVATLVAERNPKIATVERSVNARPKGAVYVDFLQNIRAKTVAGVYSVRAQPRATVSTPLRWNEVNEALDPGAFTMDTVPARIDALGDLWARGMKAPNSLSGVLTRG
ncbi:MAG TPA: DNA ligase D [Gemmatimonadaceae bacterium]|nr:DNA ligase D [Gemmatimonadaceae bacterium]